MRFEITAKMAEIPAKEEAEPVTSYRVMCNILDDDGVVIGTAVFTTPNPEKFSEGDKLAVAVEDKSAVETEPLSP